jgi:hypothetical protein
MSRFKRIAVAVLLVLGVASSFGGGTSTGVVAGPGHSICC